MDSKINIHNFWRSNIFIVLIFMVLSVLSAAILWHTKSVLIGVDLHFHWQRIYELKYSIINGLGPSVVSTNSFNQTGTAAMSMYPHLNLLPIVLITFFIKSFISQFYVSFILRNFVSLLVGYFSCYFFSRNKRVSFVFSISYTLNTAVICHYIMNNDYGISSSIIFFPLVMFGFMDLMERNKWIELTIGMTLIIYSHIINSAIIVLFLCVFAALNFKKVFCKRVLLSISKSILVTALLTSSFLIQFFVLLIKNKISMPASSGTINGAKIYMFADSIVNRINASISIIALIGLIAGVCYYRFLSKYQKQLLWISVLFLFLITNLFPWTLFNHTFIAQCIQFPYRFFVIPQLILCYIFAELFIKFFIYQKRNTILFFAVIGIILFSQMLGQLSVENKINANPALNMVYNGKADAFIINSNAELRNINNSRYYIDYLPKESVNYAYTINHHFAVYNYNKKIKTQPLGNGKFSFVNRQNIKRLSLPFVYYNGINYQVELDGKTIKGFSNENALMTINNVPKGKHLVQIIVHKTKTEIVSYILSFVGLVILLGLIINIAFMKLKNR